MGQDDASGRRLKPVSRVEAARRQKLPVILAPMNRERAAVAGEFERPPEPLNQIKRARHPYYSVRAPDERFCFPAGLSPERRCGPRVLLMRKVRLRAPKRMAMTDAELLDLSQKGLCLKTPQRIAPGTVVVGAFRADPLDRGRSTCFAARVMWCKEKWMATSRRAVGLKFVGLTAEGMRTVNRLVNGARRR